MTTQQARQINTLVVCSVVVVESRSATRRSPDVRAAQWFSSACDVFYLTVSARCDPDLTSFPLDVIVSTRLGASVVLVDESVHVLLFSLQAAHVVAALAYIPPGM